MISVTDLRAGTVFEDHGQYLLVLSYEHIKMGRGGGTVKVKVRDLETGSTVDKTFNTGVRVQEANLVRKKVQFLYKDGQGAHFMDVSNFEQFTLSYNLISEVEKFLKEGMDANVLMVSDTPVALEIAKIVDYKITNTGGSARGNTVGAAQKDAVLENGLTIKVPLFISVGEAVRVDTRSGQYVERAK